MALFFRGARKPIPNAPTQRPYFGSSNGICIVNRATYSARMLQRENRVLQIRQGETHRQSRKPLPRIRKMALFFRWVSFHDRSGASPKPEHSKKWLCFFTHARNPAPNAQSHHPTFHHFSRNCPHQSSNLRPTRVAPPKSHVTNRIGEEPRRQREPSPTKSQNGFVFSATQLARSSLKTEYTR